MLKKELEAAVADLRIELMKSQDESNRSDRKCRDEKRAREDAESHVRRLGNRLERIAHICEATLAGMFGVGTADESKPNSSGVWETVVDEREPVRFLRHLYEIAKKTN